jgi:hypothetical protein
MAVKTFTAGETATASDTNTFLANAGLVYIKQQTVGSAVASVTVSSAFSADWDNYKIVYHGGTGSDGDLQMTLGSTAAGYYMTFGFIPYLAPALTAVSINNGASWYYAGSTRTTVNTLNLDVFGPNLAEETSMFGIYSGSKAGSGGGAIQGFLNNTTQYTAFTLTPIVGTLTGGIVTVYGYRKA